MREMFLCMTVRAQENAFRNLALDGGIASIRKVSEIKFESLECRLTVVPRQGSEISSVATAGASAAKAVD